MRTIFPAAFLVIICLFAGCETNLQTGSESDPAHVSASGPIEKRDVTSAPLNKILQNAEDQTHLTKKYTQGYFTIPYPNGDLPIETGACSDVVIRSFRAAGVDLQKEVHEDMAENFAAYPKKWGLAAPDTNIDHRRVPNLQTFFSRKGKSVSITSNPEDYKPGDVVSWDLDGKGMTHVGIVSNLWNEKTKRYLIIHNLGGGTKAEDRLFDWKITGHFRYF
jgi:uncharacterized protein YijF (DUF1287 family)